jgi:hypothetical protein
MNIYFSTFLEYVFLGATATPSDSQAVSPCFSSACHRLVLGALVEIFKCLVQTYPVINLAMGGLAKGFSLAEYESKGIRFLYKELLPSSSAFLAFTLCNIEFN